MPDKTDAKILTALTASPWKTGGDHQDANVLRRSELSTLETNFHLFMFDATHLHTHVG